MIENSGTGKTHLITAISLKPCRLGYKVLFKTATTLASELREAHDNYQLRKTEKAIAGTDLLLLDELSYVSYTQDESELLFKVIAERSERTSTVIILLIFTIQREIFWYFWSYVKFEYKLNA